MTACEKYKYFLSKLDIDILNSSNNRPYVESNHTIANILRLQCNEETIKNNEEYNKKINEFSIGLGLTTMGLGIFTLFYNK
jgi:hypothetical protein